MGSEVASTESPGRGGAEEPVLRAVRSNIHFFSAFKREVMIDLQRNIRRRNTMGFDKLTAPKYPALKSGPPRGELPSRSLPIRTPPTGNHYPDMEPQGRVLPVSAHYINGSCLSEPDFVRSTLDV